MASKPFKEINPSTGRVFRLQELWDLRNADIAALTHENEALRKQCTKLLKDRENVTEKLLTNEQIIRDIKLRWAIHNKEASQAVVDVKDLGISTRKLVNPSLMKFSNWFATTSKTFRRV